ncbi:hypothetical protein EDC96DRAFT_569876 [Choanephora cucurbitarum]|nr:hypothetical protein EDC96DRAFT_569876 [Choanephora cucurbitarum]
MKRGANRIEWNRIEQKARDATLDFIQAERALEYSCSSVLEHSSTFIPPTNLEDSQFAHLKKLNDSEVTAFLASLLKNYLLALAIKKKHLFKNENIGPCDYNHQKIDSQEIAIKKYKNQHRFISNLERKLLTLAQAISVAEPGHRVLLKHEYTKLSMLQSLAYAKFCIPLPSSSLFPVDKVYALTGVVDGDRSDYSSDHESEASNDNDSISSRVNLNKKKYLSFVDNTLSLIAMS